jgi:transcriptional regulator with XRE-family HTH domain
MTPQEIVRALESKGWSQHQIARAIGISQPSLWRIATGITTGPKYYVMDALRELLRRKG